MFHVKQLGGNGQGRCTADRNVCMFHVKREVLTSVRKQARIGVVPSGPGLTA